MNPYPNKKLENYRRRAAFTAPGKSGRGSTELSGTSKIVLYIVLAIIVLLVLGKLYYQFSNKGNQIQVVQPISAFVKALLR